MLFPSGYDEYYQGVAIDTEEKTPVMNPVKEEIKPSSGIYNNCYLCGIDVARLPKNLAVALVYDRTQTKEELWAGTPVVKYVITYCAHCYKSNVEPGYKANEYR